MTRFYLNSKSFSHNDVYGRGCQLFCFMSSKYRQMRRVAELSRAFDKVRVLGNLFSFSSYRDENL